MATRKGSYRGSFERCGRCGCIASKWSVYTQRMLCNSCLSFERTVYAAQEAAAELSTFRAGLDADAKDLADTQRCAF